MAESAFGGGGSVTLVGLRGSGKSTVGGLLAERMQVPFLDLDVELARRFGQDSGQGQESAGELLTRVGEPAFRNLEGRALEACLSESGPQVLATGGGAVLLPANRALLIERSFCVWLQADPDELQRRITAQDPSRPSSQANPRPALTDLDPAAEMKLLAQRRAEHYAAVADLACPTQGLSPEIVAAEIFSMLPQ